MSHTIARLMSQISQIITMPLKPYRRAVTRALITEALTQIWVSKVGEGVIKFHCPSARSLHDVAHLKTNEPETIHFLNMLSKSDVLWDIGANVGAFSLYASIIKEIKVIAFEPSSSTYATLMKNIELNNQDDSISAFNIALHDKNKISYLYMANTEAGHSMHSFDTNKNALGEIKVKFKQSVIGYKIDDFFKQYKVSSPTHLKIDVDGNELLVLKGGRNVIEKYVKSFIIETESFVLDNDRKKLLNYIDKLGFVEAYSNQFNNQRNKIFVKKVTVK